MINPAWHVHLLTERVQEKVDPKVPKAKVARLGRIRRMIILREETLQRETEVAVKVPVRASGLAAEEVARREARGKPQANKGEHGALCNATRSRVVLFPCYSAVLHTQFSSGSILS